MNETFFETKRTLTLRSFKSTSSSPDDDMVCVDKSGSEHTGAQTTKTLWSLLESGSKITLENKNKVWKERKSERVKLQTKITTYS